MASADIPLNSLQRHIAPLHDALALRANEVISSGYFVLGPNVAEFERAFADYCGINHCVGVANGTDALELALRAIGVKAGDRVALVANAAMYGTAAVLACGGEPVFTDVDPETATMGIESLRAVLASTGTAAQVKAVIVTHLYGRLAAIDEIVGLCRGMGIPVVEDCAQAHGARMADGRHAGSFGDVASFSFYPTKNLGALGDGGAVLAADADIADRVRQLRQYGWSSKYTNELAGGRNSRLDELQASMLLVMLPLLDGWNLSRQAIAVRYSSEIRHPSIDVPATPADGYVAHLYVVRSERRDALRAHLGELGIQTDIHYPFPDHQQPCHQGRYSGISLPITERESRTLLTLPCFPEMEAAEIQRVIDGCNRFQ